MDEVYLARLVGYLRKRGVGFEEGLLPSEVTIIESKYSFRFPPDLKALLQYALPVSDEFPRWGSVWRHGFPNWRRGPESQLRDKLNWPLEGMLFDVEHNVFWMDDWGPRPSRLEDAFAIARREVARSPVLIPVYSHRYLPGEPILPGNPVLSVYQTDIIYHGYDLASYFHREFGAEEPGWAAASPRPIRFWDDVMDSHR